MGGEQQVGDHIYTGHSGRGYTNDEHSAGFEYTLHFEQSLLLIIHMLQHVGTIHHIKGVVGKRDVFGNSLYNSQAFYIFLL